MLKTKRSFTIAIIAICGLLVIVYILIIHSAKMQKSQLTVYANLRLNVSRNPQLTDVPNQQLTNSTSQQFTDAPSPQLIVSDKPINLSSTNSRSKQSKWAKNTLIVVPAIWREINWTDRVSWPSWLREGLHLPDTKSQSYYVHLYQRVDPKSRFPFDWPYCMNIHEETGVYLQFIRDHYHDLPDKMLFMHGNPRIHTTYDPIQFAQCFRDDVHFASVNENREFIRERPWYFWMREKEDEIGLMYKCAQRILILLGYDAELQLNPLNKTRKDENVISAFCCAQFYVTKERIRHYTYEQWLSLYDIIREPFCTSEVENTGFGKRTQWFGGSFEHLWHVILGLSLTNSPPPRSKTVTDRCQWLRPSCETPMCVQ